MANNGGFLSKTALIGMVLTTLLIRAVPVLGQDSLNMSRLGMVQEWWSFPVDLIVEGNYAYLLTEAPGLVIYDISNPSTPRVTSVVPADGYWGGMAKSGERLLTGGLWSRLVNVSNPELPAVYTQANTHWGVGVPAIGGNFVYATADDAGFVVWDITDPANPNLIRHISFRNYDRTNAKLAVHNGYLYYGSYQQGMSEPSLRSIHIFALNDPTRPALLPDSIAGRFYDYELDSQYLYACGAVNSEDGLYVYDITSPETPQLVGSHSLGDPVRLSVSDGRVVVTSQQSSHFFDVTDPGNPVLISTVNLGANPWSAGTAIDGLNYALAQDQQFFIMDVSVLENPETIVDQEVHTLFRLIGLRFPYAVVSTSPYDSGSYELIDVTDERNPLRLSNVSVVGEPRLLVNDVLLAAFSDSVVLYDVRNILQPERLAQIDALQVGSDGSFAVEDGYLYIVSNNHFQIYDIAEPSAPSQIVDLANTDYSSDLLVEYPLAIIGNYNNGTAVFDIVDREHPTLVETLPFVIESQETLGVAVLQNSVLYMMRIGAQDNIVDLSIPSSPDYHFSDILDTAYSIIGSDDDYLYVSTGYYPDHIVVLDIHTDPLNPQPVGFYPAYARSGLRNDDRLYVCDNFSFQILSLFGHFGADERNVPHISSFSLHPAYPNPFNGTTTISFDLPRSQPVVYDIFNNLGQNLSRVPLGELSAGAHRVSLDASAWASGSYWIKVQAGADVRSSRIMHIK